MSKLELKNLNGEKVKDIKLNDNVFGIEPNDVVLHDAIVLSMANSRQGTHSTVTTVPCIPRYTGDSDAFVITSTSLKKVPNVLAS